MPWRLSLIVGDQGFRADGGGVQMVEPEILRRAIDQVDGVEMRTVERGHPLFGPACDLIRAEALIRIDCEPPLPCGLLALGQRAELSLDARHGSELLMFLGRSLAAMIRKWLIETRDLSRPSGARAGRALGRLPSTRSPPLPAYRARLCRDRAPADRFSRPLSRRSDRQPRTYWL